MREDFWKEEEKKDKKFMKEFDKEMDEFYKSVEKENLVCNEKCIHNIENTCSIDDWSCRIKHDRKEMKALCLFLLFFSSFSHFLFKLNKASNFLLIFF